MALREEIDPIIEEEGWSKVAIGRMRKLDSFLRESSRFNGVNTSMLKSYNYANRA